MDFTVLLEVSIWEPDKTKSNLSTLIHMSISTHSSHTAMFKALKTDCEGESTWEVDLCNALKFG